MNTNAALDAATGRVGFGIIILNHVGALMGLMFVRDSSLFPCIVKSDAQVIVSLINSGVAPLLEVGIVINDIIMFLESIRNCSVSFVPRLANMAAYYLAKFSLSTDSDHFWMEAPWVASHVRHDYTIAL
ncbi:hypothetical protein Ddye_024150 [Dipteronia dyeriana]|uniref:RNase H type-1 domain-containing protein n=1 Tax=Dipteronia dyeriana TaxID=168575 RepID=A0AAD9TUS9_9ROSI|nr:hypothetical protein Ddye_024150 [Dipteronia dyeriana]